MANGKRGVVKRPFFLIKITVLEARKQSDYKRMYMINQTDLFLV